MADLKVNNVLVYFNTVKLWFDTNVQAHAFAAPYAQQAAARVLSGEGHPAIEASHVNWNAELAHAFLKDVAKGVVNEDSQEVTLTFEALAMLLNYAEDIRDRVNGAKETHNG